MTKNLYRIEVRICATAYIKAASAEEAFNIAQDLTNDAIEVSDAGGDVRIDGSAFESLDLPNVSLSPAMTIIGLEEGARAELEEENVPYTEDTSHPTPIASRDILQA